MPTAWPGTAPPFDVTPGYHPFVDYRYVHAGRACSLDADGHERHTWDPIKGDLWLTPAPWSAKSPTQNTFALTPPPISLSRFASGPYPDRSPVAPPETRTRRRSPR